MSVVLISGSPSEQSRSAKLLSYISHLLVESGQQVKTIHVRNLDAKALIQADWHAKDIQQALQSVAKAEAVVIATPVYKASYSGVLKSFLDLLPQDGLAGKSVGVIATGGSLAHALSTEYALNPVLSALGTRQFLGRVFGVDQQIEIRDNGDFRLEHTLQQRLNDLAQDVLRSAGIDADLHALIAHEFDSYIKAADLPRLSPALA